MALAALAAYMDRATDEHVEDARRAKLLLQAEIDRRGTEATVLYLLATNVVNHRALVHSREQLFTDPDVPPEEGFGDGEIGLAGEPYAGLGGVVFSVQDEAGLVPVNSPGLGALPILLEYLGAEPDAVARLMPRLVDYVDRNQDLTLDGAERFDYQRAGRAAPANWFLQSPMELAHVLGADGLLPPSQWRRVRELATPRLVPGINFTTMPEELAVALLGVKPEALGPLLEARRERSVVSPDQIRELTGRAPPVVRDEILGFPLPMLRVSTWWPEGGSRVVRGVTLTPSAEDFPWRTEYRYSEPPAIAARTPQRTGSTLFGERPQGDADAGEGAEAGVGAEVGVGAAENTNAG
ncbi:MAG: general secretion pathway protein GspK [Gammaproteobacteria bacterium]|nr:general secretion pathway protein GspK [Gammaproteobacteria bacterium]